MFLPRQYAGLVRGQRYHFRTPSWQGEGELLYVYTKIIEYDSGGVGNWCTTLSKQCKLVGDRAGFRCSDVLERHVCCGLFVIGEVTSATDSV